MSFKTLLVLGILVAGILLAGGEMSARAASYPLPFDPFLAPESFGCKHLLIPGAELLPHDPVVDSRVLPGWKEVPMKDGKNKTLESLVIKGSTVVHKKDKDGKPVGPPMVLIPAGGLVYDATPLETHLPVGDRGVIFGHKTVLVKKELQEESCRDFSVLAGRSFDVGDSVLTYLMPGPKGGPVLLWRTLDGVSIRPHPLDEYPAGHVPPKSSTRIFGVYTHAGQIAEYVSFSAPLIVEEIWRIDGKDRKVATNSEWFPHFRMVPISCPIGHHIGLMVYNDVPVLLDTEHEMRLYGGYLRIRLVKVHEKAGKVVFALNGRPYTGTHGIDSLIGRGRAIEGINNTLAVLRKIRGS